MKLIAGGELSYKAIAQRVRVGRHTVSNVARGKTRPSLQPRIEAARQSCINDARRVALQRAPEEAECPTSRTSRRKKRYDDDSWWRCSSGVTCRMPRSLKRLE